MTNEKYIENNESGSDNLDMSNLEKIYYSTNDLSRFNIPIYDYEKNSDILFNIVKDLQLDYGGVWYDDGENLNVLIEVSKNGKRMVDVNSYMLQKQLKEAYNKSGDLYLCPSESSEGGVDAIFSFSDDKGLTWYLLLDEFEADRELSDEDIKIAFEKFQTFLNNTYKKNIRLLYDKLDNLSYDQQGFLIFNNSNIEYFIKNNENIIVLSINNINKLQKKINIESVYNILMEEVGNVINESGIEIDNIYILKKGNYLFLKSNYSVNELKQFSKYLFDKLTVRKITNNIFGLNIYIKLNILIYNRNEYKDFENDYNNKTEFLNSLINELNELNENGENNKFFIF